MRNYTEKLLDSAGTPQVRYAFFRYGHSHKPIKGDLLDKWELWQKLSNETTDLLVVPMPLVYYMLMASKRHGLDQRSSTSNIDHQAYWLVPGGLITALHGVENGGLVDTVHNYNSLHWSQMDVVDQMLDLGKMRVRKTHSNGQRIVYCGPHRVHTFNITEYWMPQRDYGSWLDKFRDKHATVFKEGLFLPEIPSGDDIPF
jgi:hypothetical protein